MFYNNTTKSLRLLGLWVDLTDTTVLVFALVENFFFFVGELIGARIFFYRLCKGAHAVMRVKCRDDNPISFFVYECE